MEQVVYVEIAKGELVFFLARVVMGELRVEVTRLESPSEEQVAKAVFHTVFQGNLHSLCGLPTLSAESRELRLSFEDGLLDLLYNRGG